MTTGESYYFQTEVLNVYSCILDILYAGESHTYERQIDVLVIL